jgi:hypothetical protein
MSQTDKDKDKKPANEQPCQQPEKISKADVDAIKSAKEKVIKENQTVNK